LTPQVFDPLPTLGVLVRQGVRFVLIGGFGGRLHGSNLITNDLDICYERGDENLKRLAAALRELHAELRGASRGLPFILEAKTLRMGDHFTFATAAGALDCLGSPAGIKSYEALERNAIHVELEGRLSIMVASLDDLIRMKLAAGRHKDLEAAETLGALREEIDALEAKKRKRRRKTPPRKR
jgi:hypothetical protein